MDFLNLVLYLAFTFTIIKFLFSFLVGKTTNKHINLPPGPPRFPVIGNLLKLGNNPHISLAELAKTHGPIMSLTLGQITAVVISSPELAKEVLQKQDLTFSNRSIANALHALDHSKHSVAFLPADTTWRSLRKILNSNMFSARSLNRNKNLRQKKVEELIAYVGKRCKEGVAVDIGRATFMTAINFLSNTIFSVDLTDLDDESGTKEFKELVRDIMVEAGKPNLVDFFPFLAILDPQGVRRRLTLHFRKIIDIILKMVNERSSLRSSEGKTNSEEDVIDVLLDIVKNNTDQLNKEHILHLILDVFAAGSDTTSTSVEWIMAELLRHPRALAKAKAELEKTIGRGNSMEEADIARLPYLRAIVRENWRLHPPIPFLLPRTVLKDVEVSSYTVPKGAQVLVNAYAIGRDPKVWSNPDCFTPERFVDSDVDVRGQDFELIPFGAGRRICPGLPLAIKMVTVMAGSLINSFDWKLEDGISPEQLDMEDKFGITVQKAQPLCAIPICV